jgi:hypothetical protein
MPAVRRRPAPRRVARGPKRGIIKKTTITAIRSSRKPGTRNSIEILFAV